ncbi:kinetochore-associated protein KNL-2 isoform X2 [Capsicum chacoense]
MTFPRKRKENTTKMASPSTESPEPKSNNSSKSCFHPTVCLKDWWLVRAQGDSQGRTLAVAGLTSREGQALRVFSSAPILKVYDVFNLETIDGICVVLNGFINKSRSEENGFPSEVFGQFLFGFPPQWEAFNENCLGRESQYRAAASGPLGSENPSLCSEKVKDLKKLNQKDHVEAIGETIQDRNGREDYEVEDNLMRDNQNDGEVASEVILQQITKRSTRSLDKLNSTNQNDRDVASEVLLQKITKRSTRSSDKLNSTNTSTSFAKEQIADVEKSTHFKSANVEATRDIIQDHNGSKDHDVEDNLMRDNQNDGEVASDVTLQKITKRSTRSSDKLNSTNTSSSITKEQSADVKREIHFRSVNLEATGEIIQDPNGSKDYEVEDNLMRDNQNDGDVANEVIVQKKTKRATRSSDKLNSAITSTSIAKEQTANVKRATHFKRANVEATGEIMQDHNGSKDFEVEDNMTRDSQNYGELASEIIVQKKTKRATRSSDKLDSTSTSTSIAKEQSADVKREIHFRSVNVEATGEIIQDPNGSKDYEVEDNLMRDNQNDGDVANEVIVQKKTKRATRSSDKLNSAITSTSIAKEQTANVKRATHFKRANVEATGEIMQDHNGSKDFEVEDNMTRDSQNYGELASEIIVQKKTKRATRSSDKLDSTSTSTSIAKEQSADVKREIHFRSVNVEATGEIIQDPNGSKDYEVEDNLMRDNQNDGDVANEVIVQKKTKRATRSSDKLNSAITSTSIAKEQTANVKRATHFKRANVEATGEIIQDPNGSKDYEVEDNLMRDNENDGEVAKEVTVQKKKKRAMRSSDKLNSTNTSTSIAKAQAADVRRATHFESAIAEDPNGSKDYEVEDNLMRNKRNDGDVASEVIVRKKTKRATRSLDKLNSTNTYTSIAKEQTPDVKRATHSKSASASVKNAKRKLTYGSPQQGKEAVPLISPESLGFKRSKSGRMLLPPMAFWRNQRAVYDADQRVTAVKQGDPNLDDLFRVSRSEPSRKRR